MTATVLGDIDQVTIDSNRAVSSGDLHETDDLRVGVYLGSQDVSSGDPVTLHTRKRVEIAFADAAAQSAGDEVEFDFASQEGVALGDAAGDAIIGLLEEDKALNASTAKVILNAQFPNKDGQVVMANLPTSDPAIDGALWNNSNVVNVSAG